MSLFVISEQMGLDSFWINDILSGIKKEADKKNLKTEVFHPNQLPLNNLPVVMVVGYTKEWLERTVSQVAACRARALVVNAGREYINSDIAGSVSFDYSGAMEKLLCYLFSCGKRRIAFIGCRGNRLSFDYKADAFCKTGKELNFERADLLSCDEVSRITDTFMRQPVKYDAVICSRDVEAGFLMSRLLKNGVRLPEDVFVCSFGDSALAKTFPLSLTAVSVDYKALGEEAVRLSRYLSQKRDSLYVGSLVSCPLIIRDSTAEQKPSDEASALPKALFSYHNDSEYNSFLQAEQLVRSWDALDRKIVEALLEGRNTASVAEKLFISQSSVKYRIKKMLEEANISGRSELISLVARYGLL